MDVGPKVNVGNTSNTITMETSPSGDKDTVKNRKKNQKTTEWILSNAQKSLGCFPQYTCNEALNTARFRGWKARSSNIDFHPKSKLSETLKEIAILETAEKEMARMKR